MTSFREAFALSKDEVNNATPPGTATLVGTVLPSTSIKTSANCYQNTLSGPHHNKITMRFVLYHSHQRTLRIR